MELTLTLLTKPGVNANEASVVTHAVPPVGSKLQDQEVTKSPSSQSQEQSKAGKITLVTPDCPRTTASINCTVDVYGERIIRLVEYSVEGHKSVNDLLCAEFGHLSTAFAQDYHLIAHELIDRAKGLGVGMTKEVAIALIEGNGTISIDLKTPQCDALLSSFAKHKLPSSDIVYLQESLASYIGVCGGLREMIEDNEVDVSNRFSEQLLKKFNDFTVQLDAVNQNVKKTESTQMSNDDGHDTEDDTITASSNYGDDHTVIADSEMSDAGCEDEDDNSTVVPGNFCHRPCGEQYNNEDGGEMEFEYGENDSAYETATESESVVSRSDQESNYSEMSNGVWGYQPGFDSESEDEGDHWYNVYMGGKGDHIRQCTYNDMNNTYDDEEY